ncbi:bromo domain-containing protein [Haematococcus lacustris]|uniref:Bromo domain-containing protein n=1 Tax=Haematococcus lacustris TaxID=44745 RepID=A0A699ZJE5_HAELA|nr:bromo domain-containing protein [Haematococcus lacustris]
MYCMTGVCKFQQQFMNWQILSWTKVNEHCIKIRVQPPHPTGFDAAPPSVKKAAASVGARPCSHPSLGH